MKLLNNNKHMQGKNILCNGTRYKIEMDGLVDVSAEDALRLLAGKEWSEYKSEEATKESKKPKAPKAVKAPEKAAEPSPQPSPPVEPPAALEPAEKAVEPGSESAEGTPENTGGQGLSENDAEADEAEADEAEDLEAGENEWPDPDVSMKKDYLQEMAEAYEVEFEDKTTKAELVKLIKDKMYG